MKTFRLFLLVIPLMLLIGIFFTIPVEGAADSITLTVNTTGDDSDMNWGDGACDASAHIGEQCSLRAALEEINAHGTSTTPHRIEFDIPGTGPFTITPSSQYVDINVPVVIDGTTQNGTVCPTMSSPGELMIVLDGSAAGPFASGLILDIGSGESLVQGLVIGNFESVGIVIFTWGNHIRCNYIGIGADGETNMGNLRYGLYIEGNNNLIGGDLSLADRNVISNNTIGISLIGTENTISNNFIGTTASGEGAAGNTDNGLYVIGVNNMVGGTTPLAGNVISGNKFGIGIMEASDNTFQGNYIGVAADGATPLPNTRQGILLYRTASGNQIGGTAPGEANIIAYNLRNGINLLGEPNFYPINNSIRGNSIYGNRYLGIDLNGDGLTANDPDDTDEGANELQNYPVLSSLQGSLIITATLQSAPETEFQLDLFRSRRCDQSGAGEGEEYLETVQVTTDSSGNGSHIYDLTGVISTGQGIAVTATDPDGNTSEFSNCVTLLPAPRQEVVVNWDGDLSDIDPGDGICETSPGNSQCSLRAALEELNATGYSGNPHLVEFDIPGSGPFIIQPASALPQISVPMRIDGESQPGAACPTSNAPANLLIVLDGSGAGPSASGLVLGPDSSGSGISGLVIGKFGQSGIQIDSDSNLVRCSHIGIAPDGMIPMSNGVNGITVSGDFNYIGGEISATGRNVISGNEGVGLAMLPGASVNFVNNNFIGSTADGMSAAGNGAGGVLLAGFENVVYGTSNPDYPNVISGNIGFGVRIEHSDNNFLVMNLIGVARDGHSSLPNSGHGIEIVGGSTGNEIGGPNIRSSQRVFNQSGNANLIAYNGGHGIMLAQLDGEIPYENRFFENSIYDNLGLGIDLGDDGIDTNDMEDIDIGENERINYPWLTTQAGSMVINSALHNEPNIELLVEFYRNDLCDPSGYGEGKQHLYSQQVTTDNNGLAEFNVDLTGYANFGDYITANVTDIFRHNTSEYSNCAALVEQENGYLVLLPSVWK